MGEGKPRDETGMSVARSDSIRDILRQNVRDEPLQKRRRKRLLGIGLGGAVLVLGSGVALAATTILPNRPVTDDQIVHCLSSTQQNPDGSFPGSSATLASTDRKGSRATDALELCSELWRQGVLGASVDPLETTHAPGTVPTNLHVCVMSDGEAAVVPGDPDVCLEIGLSPLDD